jgi:hypothetical protein
MSDENPYTPPQVPDPLTTAKVVKRGVGLVVILLLTLVAVVITGGLSCAAGAAYFNAVVDQGTSYDPLAIAMVIFLAPPLFVFGGMFTWAGLMFLEWIRPPRVVSPSGDERPGNSPS